MIETWFLRHPRSVGESYGEHLAMAAWFGCRMVVAGLACLIHAAVPALFERTGSRTIAELHACMVTNRRRTPVACELDYAI